MNFNEIPSINDSTSLSNNETLKPYGRNLLNPDKSGQQDQTRDDKALNYSGQTIEKSHFKPNYHAKPLIIKENNQHLILKDNLKYLTNRFISLNLVNQESLRDVLQQKSKEGLFLKNLLNVIEAAVFTVSKGYLLYSITPDTIVIDNNKKFVLNLASMDNESTKPYLAPEEELGIDKCDKSFSWSIGCVILFILTKKDPKINWRSQKEKDWIKSFKAITNEKKIYKLLKKIFRLKVSKRIGLNDLYKELKTIF